MKSPEIAKIKVQISGGRILTLYVVLSENQPEEIPLLWISPFRQILFPALDYSSLP